MSIKLTGYKAGIDNAYKGKPDGGNDTSSRIPLDEKYATFAIPLDLTDERGPDTQRTNLNLGDIVLFENNVNGTVHRSLGLATDFGKMPHGDIDVAKGALQKNLGLTFVENANYVNGVNGAGEVSMSRVAITGASGLKNGGAINEAIVKVNAQLAANPAMTTEQIQAELEKEIANPENIKLADAREQEVTLRPRDSYGTYEDARGDRRPTGKPYAKFLEDIMAQDPMLGLFLMLIGLLTGFISLDDLTEVGLSALTGSAAGREVSSLSGGGSGGRQRDFSYGSVEPPQVWQDAWNAGKGGQIPDANQKALLAALPADVIAKVASDASGKTALYQEVAGNGHQSYGVFVYKDQQGKVCAMPMGTGGRDKGALPGAATGTGNHDPRYPDAATIPEYTITNFRTASERANQGLMNIGRYTFDIQANDSNPKDDMIEGTGRGAMRVHEGGGSSLGCLHVPSGAAMSFSEQIKGRELTLKIEPTLDRNNTLYKEIKRQEAAGVTPAAPAAGVAVAAGGAARFNMNDTNIPAPSSLNDAKITALRQDSSTSKIDLNQVSPTAIQARVATLQAVDEYKKTLDPNKPIIVLDSGHGTDAGGSTGAADGLEAEKVREFSVHAKAALEAKGFQVVDTNDLMPKTWGTGTHDGRFERATRAEIAERLGADQFVSLHMDWAGGKKLTDVYYFDDKAYAESLNNSMHGTSVIHDLHTKPKEVGVLRTFSDRQGALIELVNLQNSEQAALVRNPDAWKKWCEEKATGLANGAAAYYNAHQKPAEKVVEKPEEPKEEPKQASATAPNDEAVLVAANLRGGGTIYTDSEKLQEEGRKKTVEEIIASGQIDDLVQANKPEAKAKATPATATEKAVPDPAATKSSGIAVC